MLKIGVELLTEIGKDVNVLSYTSLALFQVHGYAGLADAFSCWNDILGDRWNNAFPEKPVRRNAGIQRFAQVMEEWVKGRPPGDDVSREVLDACLGGLDTFESTVRDRLQAEAPVLPSVREVLVSALGAARLTDCSPRSETSPASGQPVAAERASPPPTPPTPPPEPAELRVATPPPERTLSDRIKLPEGASLPDLGEIFRKGRQDVLALAERARALNPSAPEPYRLARAWAWALATLPARDERRPELTPLEFVHQQTADNLRRLAREHAWTELLVTAEKIWPRALFWLDPHLNATIALRGLGHEAAAVAVEGGVTDLIRRLPDLVRLHFSDGTAFASEATRLWTQGLRSESHPALPLAPARALAAPRFDVPDDPIEDDAITACMAQLDAARPVEAAALMEVRLRAMSSGRDHFYLRLQFAHALLDRGHTQSAMALLHALDEEARERQLDQWEPMLAAALLHGLLRARAHPRKAGEPERSPEAQALCHRAARLGALTLLFEP